VIKHIINNITKFLKTNFQNIFTLYKLIIRIKLLIDNSYELYGLTIHIIHTD